MTFRTPRILWDKVSRQYFDAKSVRTEVYGLPNDLQLGSVDLVSLSGAPRNSIVQCSGIGGVAINVVVGNEDYFEDPFTLTLTRGNDQTWEAKVHYLRLKRDFRRMGLSARMFACTARAACRLGIAVLRMHGLHIEASQTPTSETWSGVHAALALGWDAWLADRIRDRLPESLRGAQTVRQLLEGDAGRSWWKENPSSLDLFFDATHGSDCMRRLNAYTNSKRIRIGQ